MENKTFKAHTDLDQAKKLSEILPPESADMFWKNGVSDKYIQCFAPFVNCGTNMDYDYDVPCWSLAALLKILHRNEKDIVSLSYGGYKDGKYILNWCLDYETENGDYIKTFGDDSVDACVEMILRLHELKKNTN